MNKEIINNKTYSISNKLYDALQEAQQAVETLQQVIDTLELWTGQSDQVLSSRLEIEDMEQLLQGLEELQDYTAASGEYVEQAMEAMEKLSNE